MFNKRLFDMMKPRGFLVNTARGKIVDREAVKEALDSGHLQGEKFWPDMACSYEVFTLELSCLCYRGGGGGGGGQEGEEGITLDQKPNRRRGVKFLLCKFLQLVCSDRELSDCSDVNVCLCFGRLSQNQQPLCEFWLSPSLSTPFTQPA